MASASWNQLTPFGAALTLEERAALPRPAAGAPASELAHKRLARWRAQAPFADQELFARRLAQDGVDEAALLELLGESPEALAGRTGCVPDWLRDLDDALGRAASAPLPFPESVLREPEGRFLELAAPLVQSAVRRLAGAVESIAAGCPQPPFDVPTVARLLLAGLPGQLLWAITRVGVLELNVARLEGRIPGDTPEERFDAFIELVRRPGELRTILARYPVLARQMAIRVGHWLDASIELLERLSADWPAIRAQLGPSGDPGPLVNVRSGAGDRHRGGRTVCLLTFASGWRLVYKPRPMAIAAHFQDLLGWMNRRGFEPGFRRLGVLDRGAYGWMELASTLPCASEAEVERFYERMGGYLALLYALDASDFHHENLIAAGEHPLLIDLESIVQPRAPALSRADSDWLATQVISRSVLRVGFLPQRMLGGVGEGIDISGLGTPQGQLSPDAHPYYERRGTDAMRLARRQFEMGGEQHRPRMAGGAAVDVGDHVNRLVDGFRRGYLLLCAHGSELMAAGGPVASMAGDEIRVILRPTRTYGGLLQESYHPFLMADALERDRHFDHLWIGVTESPPIEDVVAAERRELAAGDIPLFGARLDSRDLLGAGGQRWPGFFERSGLELVRDRVASLDAGDLDKQTWFIRASLAAHHINQYGPDGAMPALGVTPSEQVDPERFLAAAAAVGDRLGELALESGGEATWIGLHSTQGRDWRLTPLGRDLYSGLPGVAVFLAQLAALTGEARYLNLARAAWSTVWNQRAAVRDIIRSIGGFDGHGGMLWALAQLDRLWGGEDLLAEAHAVVERMGDLVAEDEAYDVLAGAAGAIAGLLALHGAAPSDRILAVAAVCGEHLLERARPMARGAAWLSPAMKRIAAEPLTGFAHGAAGCGWAMLELAAATGDDRFRRAAVNAFEYERGLFEPELGTWREVRTIDRTSVNVALSAGDDIYMLAWCHGAPGIGLSRLRALRRLPDPELRAEAAIAVESTLARGFDRSHCLCHGDLGNAELLLEAGLALGDGPRWRAEANRAGGRVLESIATHGWRSGLPRGVEVPGLMTGLAGIGYGFLRLARPAQVPSVLLLDPPAAR